MNNNKLLMIVVLVMILLGAGLAGSLAWKLLRPQLLPQGAQINLSAELDRGASLGSYRLTLQVELEPPAGQKGESKVEARLESGLEDCQRGWVEIWEGGWSQ